MIEMYDDKGNPDAGLLIEVSGELASIPHLPKSVSERVLDIALTLADGSLDDTRIINAIVNGDIEVESMGTTKLYQNIWSKRGNMFVASYADVKTMTFREACLAALKDNEG